MDHDEDQVNNIVLPLMNVSRRMPDGTVNLTEPNQQVISLTSAGSKSSFGYARLVDTFESSIITPRSAFVMGCDYRVPVLHGLLDADFVNKLKMSPSYNEESFAKEYQNDRYSQNIVNCWEALKLGCLLRSESRNKFRDGVRFRPNHRRNGQSAAKSFAARRRRKVQRLTVLLQHQCNTIYKKEVEIR